MNALYDVAALKNQGTVMRARRLVLTMAKEPTSTIVGLIVLPLIHVVIKRRWCDARRLALLLVDKPVAVNTDTQRAHRIGQAVHIGARIWRLDGRSCVAKSIIVWVLCQRRGLPVSVAIGKEKLPENDHREFHAWVEIHGIPINEPQDILERMLIFDRPLLKPEDGRDH